MGEHTALLQDLQDLRERWEDGAVRLAALLTELDAGPCS